MGGYAHIKSLVERLRHDAGTTGCLYLDGGDLWQGSGLANLTMGAAMVELANMLGLDAMTGHWEFTYGEDKFKENAAAFKGRFLAQNVFLTDEAALNGSTAFDTASGRALQPFMIRQVGDRRVAVIGQAFPYVPIAHPQSFVPNWTFGIRDAELQKLVDSIRDGKQADAIVLLSHNGMDVDLKLAARVSGIDVILGGHTHDAIPTPTIVTNRGGKTVVANGGSNGKFVGLLDLDIGHGRLNDYRYTLIPVFSNLLPANQDIARRIEELESPHQPMLSEELARVDELLYRRGNFTGTMDQIICDAVRHECDAQIALSPGFRWGPSLLPGDRIRMKDLLAQTAITYPNVVVKQMTGAELKDLLEDVCDNLFNEDPYLQQGGDMIRVGGMDYACTPGNRIGSRISDMTLNDGGGIDATKNYKVATWASVSDAPMGKPIWDVVAAYLRAARNIKVMRQNRVLVKGADGNPGIGT
jgi:sulfur-oxidizing protein SoxB